MSMKTNKFLRIASVLLIAVLLTTCVISGTFAKYVSTASGSDTASVAKWSFEVNDTEITTANTFTFNLFNTIKDNYSADPAAGDETDVKTDKIAPGTSGSFDIVLENTSEVTAKYAIDYTVTKNAAATDLPILFSVDGGAAWTADIADVAASDATELAMESGTTTVTVLWKWDFERAEIATNDPIDTGFGIAAQGTGDAVPQITVTAAVTATQVD